MARASADPPAVRSDDRRWRDLRKRALSAAVLGPLALLAIWLGAGWYTLMLALGTAVLAWEWVHLCGKRVRVLPGLAVPAALLAAGLAAMAEQYLLAVLILPLGALTATWAAEPAPRRLPGGPALWLGAGIVYIGLAGVGLIWLRGEGEPGRATVLFIVLIVWAADIGAYMVGRLVGGPRLAPAISPNKTWSGTFGGLVAAIGAGIVVATSFDPGARLLLVGLIAGLVGVAAAVGDLFESALKRHFQVKDSSGLIPGHGGLLDRVDGLLAAVPVACLIAFAQGFTRGGDRFLWT